MSNSKVRFQLFSDDEVESEEEIYSNTSKPSSSNPSGGAVTPKVDPEQLSKFKELKDVLKLVNPKKYNLIPKNTKICYWTVFETIVFNKYFKKIVDKNGKPSISVGFSTSNHRSYSIPIENIKKLYTYGFIQPEETSQDTESEESDSILKNTILIKKDEWEKIPTGTTISYEKTKDSKMQYRVKFNSIVDGKKGKLMSCTGHTGFNYVIKLTSIAKIYRHILPMDFTIIQLLESVNDLKKRIIVLEKKILKEEDVKKNSR